MDNIDKNQRKIEAARRRLKLEEEKQIKFNTFLQDNESREQRASIKREEGIRKAKEKAEAKNQRVRAVSESIKAQENDFEKCKCGSFRGSRRTSTFHLSLPCTHQQKNYIFPPSRQYSMDTLSAAHKLRSPPSPPALAVPSLSSPKSKSIANLKAVFEPSPKTGHHSNIKKLAKSIRIAAIHTKHFAFSSSHSQPQPTVYQTSEEILDEMDRLKMDIAKKDDTINQLEEYIDNLLCKIIENCPHLLELD